MEYIHLTSVNCHVDGYCNLAEAIILQAVLDYRRCTEAIVSIGVETMRGGIWRMAVAKKVYQKVASLSNMLYRIDTRLENSEAIPIPIEEKHELEKKRSEVFRERARLNRYLDTYGASVNIRRVRKALSAYNDILRFFYGKDFIVFNHDDSIDIKKVLSMVDAETGFNPVELYLMQKEAKNAQYEL